MVTNNIHVSKAEHKKDLFLTHATCPSQVSRGLCSMTSSLGSMSPLQLELEGSRYKRQLLSLTVAIDCSCLEERFKPTTHRPKLVAWLYWGVEGREE